MTIFYSTLCTKSIKSNTHDHLRFVPEENIFLVEHGLHLAASKLYESKMACGWDADDFSSIPGLFFSFLNYWSRSCSWTSDWILPLEENTTSYLKKVLHSYYSFLFLRLPFSNDECYLLFSHPSPPTTQPFFMINITSSLFFFPSDITLFNKIFVS